MRTLLFVTLLIPAAVLAQDTAAPTFDERVGSPRGANTGDYNVVQSWEFGGRYASIGGDQGKYRSDVNYRSGASLLQSNLTVNSKDGHGHWFDEIVLSTQGLGSDPYQSATLRVQKNQWYRYDLLWRQNDYFNPGLILTGGQHLEDTTHRWQDHDLTLFPQSHFRLRAGYSRVALGGPALTTEQEFDARSGAFPIFRNIRDQYNEYRLAGDAEIKGFRLTLQRRWEYFKEDTKDNQTTSVPGVSPSVLTSFTRPAPYRGRTPGWMGNIYGERKWLAINGRFTFANGKGDFVQNELATGIDRFGAAANRQIVVTGNGDRPVTTGDLSITLLPASRFSIVNQTSGSNTRMVGNNFYQQFDNATFSFAGVNFQLLALRLITNSTTARLRVSKRFDLFGGFLYSDRQIRSNESAAEPGFALLGVAAEQSNQTHAGVAGFNWIAVKNLRLHADTELGRNDNPFTPVSLRNYHNIRAQAQYRVKTLRAAAGYRENYNNNSIQITAYSSHARTYTAETSWSPKSWVSLDASYSRLHLDTIGGIQFFAGSPRATLNTGVSSLYVSNIHAANLGVRFALGKRADLYAGYNITKDTGDGRVASANLFGSVQTFPLTYQTPLLRVSVSLTSKLRYNLGYQYYGYREDFGLLGQNQGYRANTGYTSLLWSF